MYTRKLMKIALVHYRTGETDGVSLEMDKWKLALKKLGHEAIYISGSSNSKDTIAIPEIAYNDKLDLKIGAECYDKLSDYDCKSLHKAILVQAEIIKDKFINAIKTEKIDCLVPNNIFALGKSLPIAIGLLKAIDETNVKVINHHHDFFWERNKYSMPTCSFIKPVLNDIFPPARKNMKHAVINSLALDDLFKRRGLKSTVVPNVFDFHAPLWKKDNYNNDFNESFGLDENDIVFLQATRVTNRKSIELTIKLLERLNKKLPSLIGKTLYDGRIITKKTKLTLLVVGLHEGLYNYEERLIEYAQELKVKMVIDSTKVSHSRKMNEMKRIYSLWDAYVCADIVSYPSTYEGWGNQFLEGLFAKKPMIVFEYSVFEKDIAPHDFNYISLGNKYQSNKCDLHYVSDLVNDKAVDETISYLFDKQMRLERVEENFEIGRKFYSLATLESILAKLFV